MRKLRELLSSAAVAVACAAALGGCGGGAAPAPDRVRGAALTIGFIYVGSRDDLGYNEAAYEGALAVRRAFPKARLLQAENVPESAAAETVMQSMIDSGASIIFATSFGHLDAALKVAARNPRVIFLHQGGLQTAANLGTYFSTIWAAQYAAGQVAGLTTKSDRLGYVAAFPISQSLQALNAYQLGARSVNPRVRTRVVFTSDWCDPARQRRAARTLLRWHADVLSQHQDCTRTVIEEAAAAGVKATGFHYDARRLAPETWLTGAAWDWRRLYVNMVRAVVGGRFATSAYSDRYRGGLADGTVRLASFGPSVPRSVQRRVLQTIGRLRTGELKPFTGPIRDQAGNLRIPGPQPDETDLEETDYLVDGVVGVLKGR